MSFSALSTGLRGAIEAIVRCLESFGVKASVAEEDRVRLLLPHYGEGAGFREFEWHHRHRR